MDGSSGRPFFQRSVAVWGGDGGGPERADGPVTSSSGDGVTQGWAGRLHCVTEQPCGTSWRADGKENGPPLVRCAAGTAQPAASERPAYTVGSIPASVLVAVASWQEKQPGSKRYDSDD